MCCAIFLIIVGIKAQIQYISLFQKTWVFFFSISWLSPFEGLDTNELQFITFNLSFFSETAGWALFYLGSFGVWSFLGRLSGSTTQYYNEVQYSVANICQIHVLWANVSSSLNDKCQTKRVVPCHLSVSTQKVCFKKCHCLKKFIKPYCSRGEFPQSVMTPWVLKHFIKNSNYEDN